MANKVLIVKKLMSSDLGWFSVCRTPDITRSNQCGLNIDKKFISSLFPNFKDRPFIPVEVCYWQDGELMPKKVEYQIRHQGKNWRLTGEIEGDYYSGLKPGDYILLFFNFGSNKTSIYWEIACQNPKMGRLALYEYIQNEIGENLIVQDSTTKRKIYNHLKDINVELYEFVKNSEVVQQQVKKAFSSRHVLADIMATVVTLSSKTQVEYIDILERIVERFRYLLKDQIFSIDLNHKEVWDSVKGKKIGFIDGGVASINSLGSEPIAIRVGEYTVRPGVTGEDRETFKFKAQLVDELYDYENSIFDEYADNFSKLLDMARIYTEAGAVYKSIHEKNKCDMLFLHGPLVNPAAPYADFPNFKDKALEMFGLTRNNIKGDVEPPPDLESHFIASYQYLLQMIFKSDIPICGIVERSTSSRIVSRTLLNQLKNRGFALEAELIRNSMDKNRISDALLFSCLLKEGEYLRPLKVDKNELGKSPDRWKPVIDNYPDPLTTYLKVTDTSYPFRVEMNKENGNTEFLLSFVYHMARLLPQYAFPVGLDIVDKFAKVPVWMTKQISREQSAQILHKALTSGRKDIVDLVRLYLSGNSRDWLFRPKYDR
ncbi:DNA double-strand break repair nuclease NurA [Brevibacillus laterosporus]|uniref:DNA double-strand break repair nuclease NurA n=1 Tax=Brevibacillus laterosporus TaxID=1465 RepID=UPI0003B1B595|nr:DNA double-strand break repair nuclease NurA [Brevibacillus laterosporus]ERM19946.1 hypothetical protein P615_08615 [Brevibacillus laterosporus PE36]